VLLNQLVFPCVLSSAVTTAKVSFSLSKSIQLIGSVVIICVLILGAKNKQKVIKSIIVENDFNLSLLQNVAKF